MKENRKVSRILKYAVVMSLLVGGLNFGLPARAVDISSGSELTDSDIYQNSNTLNITNDITIEQGFFTKQELPSIRDAINIEITGNGHTISGELLGEHHSGYELSDGAAFNVDNVKFSNLTHFYDQTEGSGDVNWDIEGALIHTENSAGTLTIKNTTFQNNNTNIEVERTLIPVGSSNTPAIHTVINGGLINSNTTASLHKTTFSDNKTNVNIEINTIIDRNNNAAEIKGGTIYNTSDMSLSDSDFTNNAATSSATISSRNNSTGTSSVLGGALYNSGNLTISNTNFTGNSGTAQGTAGKITVTAQGGAIYNAGTISLDGGIFSGNSVTATGGTAQGGAIYNAANSIINISNTTFKDNTQNSILNDIYFADNSTMNVKNGGDVVINSGLASENNTAKINIENGGNLVAADANSADYKGSVDIKSGGKLTFASASKPSLENAIISVVENGGSVEYKIGSDFTLTENNFSLANGVTSGNVIKSGNNTMTINGDFSDFAGQVFVKEGILKYIVDDANDKYYAATSTTISNGATLIFDNSFTEGGGVTQTLAGLTSENPGDGSFIKEGEGILYLTDTNTAFTGNVNINNGILSLDKNQGATTDSFFGNGTNITIAQNGVLYSNIDMAVNGGLKGDGTFKADNINLNAGGDNSNLANFIQNGGITTVNTDSSLFKNNNITDGKVIFNSGSYLANGSTFTSTNSIVEILNNTDANSIIGTVNNGTNTNLDLILNNSNTTADLEIDGTKIETLITQGNVTYGGNLTGVDGSVKNEGTLTIDGNTSGFIGVFTQTSGSTTVTSTGSVFGGDKNIEGGSLTINRNDVSYAKVHLSSNTSLNHIASAGMGTGLISSDIVNFIDGATGATASFTNGSYSLSENIDNGNSNSIIFDNSTVTLFEHTEFKGGTNYVLKNNSTLDLANGDSHTLKNYHFDNLETNGNTKLDIDVAFKDGGTETQGYIDTDTLYVANQGGNTAEFQIGNIFISGKETGNSRYDTDNKDVLGGNAKFAGDGSEGTIKFVGATTSYKYELGTTANHKSIYLETTGMTDAATLYDMNKISGGRFFQFSIYDKNGNSDSPITYQIDKSLSATAEGVFNITGRSDLPYDSILSGKIADGSTVTYENGSFFNIADGVKTELNISNVTIQDAYKDGTNYSTDPDGSGSTSANGSVIENNSTSAVITLDNSIIQNNSATGNGGAIYNNGGILNITDSRFSNNTATLGGAIYNESGILNISNTLVFEGTGDGDNDIFNAGTMNLAGINGFRSDITNNGIISNTGYSVILGDIKGNSTAAELNNSGELVLGGDNYGYQGSFTQIGLDSATAVTGKFFGNSSNTIENGKLLWATSEAWSGDLTVNDGQFVIGGDFGEIHDEFYNNIAGKITLTSGSISQSVSTIISKESTLTLDGNGVIVNLNDGNSDSSTNDSWLGTVNLNQGTLNLDGLNGNGILAATGGNLNLNSGNLVLNTGSSIADTVNTVVKDNTTTYIQGGSVHLNETDIWDGKIIMSSGDLTVDKVTGTDGKHGNIYATGGTFHLADASSLYIEEGSLIAHNVKTTIGSNTTTEITGGRLQIGNDDSWASDGTIHLNGGTLDYAATSQGGILDADKGNLNLNSGSILTIVHPSAIEQAVAVDIQKGATVNVAQDAVFNLDAATNDKWNGMIHLEDGILTTDGITNSTGAGGGLQQVSGSSTFDNESHIYITDENSYIIGGDVSILNKSSLYLGPDTYEFVVDNLNMNNNSTLQVMNGVLDEAEIGTATINDLNNVTVDLDARHRVGDTFIIDNLKSDTNGILNISDFNFIGGSPVDREIKFQIFDADSIENVDFMATNKAIFTPIGNYKLFSQGAGLYTANLVSYNPQVFRGQASTLAMYNNQLAIDDIILNHVILHSGRYLDSDKTANKYASVDPMFAPYQYKKDEGGLWFKTYVNFETLSMSQGLNVGNNAYGSIIGADFPVVDMGDGWKFLPTAFVAYSGSNQNFNSVNMYQNGGQGGFMGTFMKNDFIGSIMAYAGGYNNEMQVAGFNENTGNWFAGTAAKLAYNLHATEHFTVQPTAFISYNIFGKQSWGTDYGVMGMNSGLLNGVNVAPGLNLIYARDTWSVYGTIQYMFNINEQVGGQAGNVDLPNLNMRHGYLQYGIGATKTWKERLNSYIQITLRNGGRTGVGFQLGLQYMFDWLNFGKKKNNANANQPKQKTIIKSMK